MAILKKLGFVLMIMCALTIGAVGCGGGNDQEEGQPGQTMEEGGGAGQETAPGGTQPDEGSRGMQQGTPPGGGGMDQETQPGGGGGH